MAKFRIITPAAASFTVAGGGYDDEMGPLAAMDAEMVEGPTDENGFIAAAKGLAAGITNIALALALGARFPAPGATAAALTVGFLGYGVSLALYVVALRGLVAARAGAYFASDEDADAFEMELTAILLNQKAAFNSPVWFNVGFEEQPQCSACFILSVDDTMESILDWNTKEGMIFRGGSGSGINLSNIRGSVEHLSKGGLASGPVSFMRGADAWAGTIKSGGKTRRAAKMVVLNVDHPDIEHFIWCKAKEEEKAEALRDAGFDMSIDGEGFT